MHASSSDVPSFHSHSARNWLTEETLNGPELDAKGFDQLRTIEDEGEVSLRVFQAPRVRMCSDGRLWR